MNGLFPVFAYLFGWLERQGNFTAILTGFGLFFLGIYIWRTGLAHRRAKQQSSDSIPEAGEQSGSVDFKNPYAAQSASVSSDSVGKSFDRMLSPPDQPPSRAFRVYMPHSSSPTEEERIQTEDANRVYIWE